MIKDKIPRELIEEWLGKLKKELDRTKSNESKGDEILKNIHAYIIDTEHFLEKGDYVKAWELISFAWGLFECGEEIGKIKKT
ncbi:MAG: DUF357 domain-containing protein [Candidatus Aenigmarchaeota archaeon]|nr:DUF357 domain-containing protein [Candidatus Aenigmarchaeota archaeon]